jgi:hypothetical protein
MSRIVSVAVLVVTAFFLSVSFSFASEAAFNSEFLVAYNKSYDSFEGSDNSKDVEKPTVSYSIDDDEIVGEHILFDKRKNEDFLSSLEGMKAPFNHNPGQMALNPMIGDVAYHLFNNRNSGNKPEKFDLTPPSTLSEVAQMGAAFFTNLVVHEFGHAIVADYAGARENKVDFFQQHGDTFFLGTSSVSEIDDRSLLSYRIGGEVFADMTFEHALNSYREKPTRYNKSLLMFSGTDFLWYCFYAFYVSDGNESFDPIGISEETGMSKNALFSVILAKTAMNAYRVYTGEDRVIPYFTVDKYSAALNVAIPFQDLWIEKSQMFN